VVRSAFEAAAVGAWPNKPSISPEQRVKRGLCEQLYSAGELVRLKLEDGARERFEHWETVAASLAGRSRSSVASPWSTG
jgi:hypothetical protein